MYLLVFVLPFAPEFLSWMVLLRKKYTDKNLLPFVKMEIWTHRCILSMSVFSLEDAVHNSPWHIIIKKWCGSSLMWAKCLLVVSRMCSTGFSLKQISRSIAVGFLVFFEVFWKVLLSFWVVKWNCMIVKWYFLADSKQNKEECKCSEASKLCSNLTCG